jgi:lipid A 3-O-deacylase
MRARTLARVSLTSASVALVALSPLAHAFDLRPEAFTVQAGASEHSVRMVGAGLRWAWHFDSMRKSAELTGHTELLANQWRAELADRSAVVQYTQLVLLPTLRMQLARGASPWFFEVGVGVSWTDHAFQTPGHTFSTQWNFQEVLGAGYVLGGPRGRDEIQLRLGHFSNAGLENPNPGETYLQLRYARRF